MSDTGSSAQRSSPATSRGRRRVITARFIPPPRITGGHLLVLALIVGISVWAVRQRPSSILVGQARVFAGTSLTLRETRNGPADVAVTSWDMELRLDPGLRPPGPDWILHEGIHPGSGYELHWFPRSQVMQIRRGDRDGFLLGTVRLETRPTQVLFSRRSGEISATIDGTPTLRCLDVLPSEGARGWGCATNDLGESTLTVSRIANEGRPALNAAMRNLGLVLHGDDETRSHQALIASERNLGVIRGLGDDAQPSQQLVPDDLARLRLWLAFIRVSRELPDPTSDSSRSPTAPNEEDLRCDLEALFTAIDLSSGRTPPEATGMLLALTQRIAAQVAAVPDGVHDVATMLGHRQQWAPLLGLVASQTLAVGGQSLSPTDADQLRLTQHIAGCLCQLDDPNSPWKPLPVPLDAPAWLAGRWRAFAGCASGPWPPAPAPGPLIDTIDGALTDSLGLRPLSAIGLRQHLIDTLRDGLLQRTEELLNHEAAAQRTRRCDEAISETEGTPGIPTRERVLTRAILALHVARFRPDLLRRAATALNEGWCRRDPLAFALASLMHTRHPGALKELPRPQLRDALVDFPEYTPLLRGVLSPIAWRVKLPPTQALAIALVMQEVLAAEAGSAAPGPDWGLLERLPGSTLPLPLLAPPRAAPEVERVVPP